MREALIELVSMWPRVEGVDLTAESTPALIDALGRLVAEDERAFKAILERQKVYVAWTESAAERMREIRAVDALPKGLKDDFLKGSYGRSG